MPLEHTAPTRLTGNERRTLVIRDIPVVMKVFPILEPPPVIDLRKYFGESYLVLDKHPDLKK